MQYIAQHIQRYKMDSIDEYGSLSMVAFGFGVHIVIRSLAIMILGPNPPSMYYEITAVTIWAIFAAVLWGPDWIKSRSGKEPVYGQRQYSLLTAVAVGFLTSLVFLVLLLTDMQGTFKPTFMLAVGVALTLTTARRADLMFK